MFLKTAVVATHGAKFSSMCDFADKYIKLPKLSFVLKNFSECPGVFFIDTKINSINIWTFHSFYFITMKI